MADVNVGRLVVQLEAEAGRFSRSLQRARRDLNRTERRSRRFGSVFGRSFGRATVQAQSLRRGLIGVRAALFALTGGALALAVRQSAALGDSLTDVADRLGLTVEELQELRFAARQLSGIEARQFDLAWQRLSRRIGEAAAGTGELRPLLDQLGISVRNADGTVRSAADVFLDLSDAARQAGSQNERLRIAFKAFDSEGAALVTTLSAGADAIDRFREDARRAGAVLDDEAARGLAAFNKDLGTLGETLRTQFARGLTKQLGVDTLADALTPETIANFGQLANELGRISGHILTISEKVGPFLTLLREGGEMMFGRGNPNIRPLPFPEARIAPQTAAAPFGPPGPAPPRPPRPGIVLPPGAFAGGADLEDLKRRQKEFADAVVRANLQAKNRVVALIELERNSKLEQLETLKLAEDKAQKLRVLIHETAAEEIRELAEEETSAIQRSFERFSGFFGNVLGDLVVDADFSFDSIARSFTSMLVRMEAEALARNLSGALTGGANTPSLLATGGSALLAGARFLIPGLQHGGIVTRPTVAALAEREPELVLPLSKLSQIAAPEINIITTERTETRTSNRNGREVIEVIVGDVLLSDAARGGPISRSLNAVTGASRAGGRV